MNSREYHREYMRGWRKLNPEKVLAMQTRAKKRPYNKVYAIEYREANEKALKLARSMKISLGTARAVLAVEDGTYESPFAQADRARKRTTWYRRAKKAHSAIGEGHAGY